MKIRVAPWRAVSGPEMLDPPHNRSVAMKPAQTETEGEMRSIWRRLVNVMDPLLFIRDWATLFK